MENSMNLLQGVNGVIKGYDTEYIGCKVSSNLAESLTMEVKPLDNNVIDLSLKREWIKSFKVKLFHYCDRLIIGKRMDKIL